jgi:hypothetical protein
MDAIFNRLIAFFSSLKVIAVCLMLAIVLVFLGTMAQEPMGLYLAQKYFFHSFFVPAEPMWAAIKKSLQMVHIYLPPSSVAEVLHGSRWPVFPGGYLVGGMLVLGLITSLTKMVSSHLKRYGLDPGQAVRRAGIWMVHLGLIVLLLGQLSTDYFARESRLHLREGEARNYSESATRTELVVVDTSDPSEDEVVAIPQSILAGQREITHPELPFTLRVKDFFPNSTVENRTADALQPPAATRGVGTQATLKEELPVTAMDRRDVPSAVIEVLTPSGSLGTWLLSEYIDDMQNFTWNNRTYALALRLCRYYTPFAIKLLEFRHDVYAGSDIPRNFSSRVLVEEPGTGEKRETLIYMNRPLRYAGETYYQESFDPDNHGTVLQVVHNPSWVTPYVSSIIVGLGLLLHFTMHLVQFVSKRRPV